MRSNQIVLLILPLQLFDLSHFKKDIIDRIYIVEEHWYFTRYRFHKMKLAYQRSCMKHFEQDVKQQFKDISVKYVDFRELNGSWYNALNTKYKSKLAYFDPIDKSVQALLKRTLPSATILETRNYWLSEQEMDLFERGTRYHFNSLFTYQKEKFVQLLDKSSDFGIKNSKSQDAYNRNKIPKNKVPDISIPNLQQDQITKQSILYVKKHFDNNYGDLPENIPFPVTAKSALKWLRHFFEIKLLNFGKYQDAIDLDNPYLYHSVISPMLNVGILTDAIVVDELIQFLYDSKIRIPLQSLEAFLRQVLGWRNYIFLVYSKESKSLYKENQLSHSNKFNNKIWEGNTGITVIDRHIEILNKTSYLNHIGRLMVMGNFMLLLQIDPVQVLDWFSTMFIDSCDTLMVPNIIMSQYNSNIMMTRFYISSFNYIQQMSNEKYPQSDKQDWDILFHGFLITHPQLGLTSYVYASSTKKLISLPDKAKKELKARYKATIKKYATIK